MYKFGTVQKKILLTFLGGIALGSAGSSMRYFKTLKAIKGDWDRINQNNFNRSLDALIKQELLETKQLKNGSYKLVLTSQGKFQAKKLSLLGSTIKFKKPKRWNKKWLLVIFDIPEKDRKFRDVLRRQLKSLEFKKLQNSVFVSPYPFEKPILELVFLYRAERFVKTIIATFINNEKELKKYFFNK